MGRKRRVGRSAIGPMIIAQVITAARKSGMPLKDQLEELHSFRQRHLNTMDPTASGQLAQEIRKLELEFCS